MDVKKKQRRIPPSKGASRSEGGCAVVAVIVRVFRKISYSASNDNGTSPHCGAPFEGGITTLKNAG